MKITIKISFSQFQVLCGLFEGFEFSNHLDRETKVRASVLDEVVRRLKKKFIDQKSTQDLFNQKKKIKLDFKFYEAHYLEKYIEVFDTFSQSDDVYFKTTIRKIRADLNAKLA